MHICVDGRSISHPRRGGFKTYIENLMAAVAQDASEFDFIIVYDRPHSFTPIADHPRFQQVVIPAGMRIIGQLRREHFGLPIYASRNPGALWHFPYNRAPLCGIEDYVLTLHDVTPFMHTPRLDWSRPLTAVKELVFFYYPRLLIRRSARRARAIITVSGYSRDRIIERLRVPSEKVHVTPLAAAPVFRLLSARERRTAGQALSRDYGLDKPFLLTVASSLLKNPQGVVEAFARLPASLRARYYLVIAMAHRRAYSAVREVAERHGLAGKIRVLVNVEPEILVWLYNLAEVLVYPSFTESFPLPTVEAMSCGTPTICSNTTGFPEQVGDAALTIPPEDTDAIVHALQRVLRYKDLRLAMAEASLRRARQFSWDETARQTLDVYRSVVSG